MPRFRLLTLLTLLLISVIYIATFMVSMNHFNDFSILYIAGKCWLQGLSPYQLDNIKQIAIAHGLPDAVGLDFLYPPCSLPIFAIFAFFSWPVAKVLFWFCNSLLLTASMAMGAKLVSQRLGLKYALLFFTVGMISIPPIAALRIGNTPVLVTALCLWAIYQTKNILGAGMALGVAWLKPQITLPVFLFLAVARKWRVVATATITAGILTTLGCLRTGGTEAVALWLKNTAVVSSTGYNSPDGGAWQHLIGFYTIFFRVGFSYQTSVTLGNAASLALMASCLYLCRECHKGIRIDHLALLNAASMLFLYHHMYDAISYVWVLIYFLYAWNQRIYPHTITCLGLTVSTVILFLLPSIAVVGAYDFLLKYGFALLAAQIAPLRSYLMLACYFLLVLTLRHRECTQEIPLIV